ncbi:MAG: TlpA disulfide reductase family protein [Oscillospiraceae bacterium]
MKRICIPLALLLALSLALTACSSRTSSAAPPDESASSASEPASEESRPPILGSFTTSDLDGNAIDQTVLAEHPLTMVNVWATFCGYCLKEMPDLAALNEEYADQGFQVIGLVADVYNRDGSLSESQLALAREAAEKTGASYLQLIPSSDLQSCLLQQVSAYPTTLFVDKNGKQVGLAYSGAKDKAAWAKMIEELLAAEAAS